MQGWQYRNGKGLISFGPIFGWVTFSESGEGHNPMFFSFRKSYNYVRHLKGMVFKPLNKKIVC